MPRKPDPNSQRSIKARDKAARDAIRAEEEQAATLAAQAERDALQKELTEARAEAAELRAQRNAPSEPTPEDTEEPEEIEEAELPSFADYLELEEEDVAAYADTAKVQSNPDTDFGEPEPQGGVPEPEPEPQAEPTSSEPQAESSAEGMGATYTADLVLSVLDKVNTFIGDIAYDYIALSPKERIWLRQSAQNVSTKARKGKVELDLSEEEVEVLDAYARVEESKKKLPFSDAEKEMLHKPLKKAFEASGKTVSPMKAFFIALIVIMVVRLTPVYMSFRARKERANRAKNTEDNSPETDGEYTEAIEVL